MILSSHIVIASAATASFISQPFSLANSVVVFCIAFFSHYLADFVPHWDYQLASIEELPVDNNGEKKKRVIVAKKTILSDLLKNLIDGCIGLIVIIFIFGFPADFKKLFLISLVVFASIFPDVLEVSYLFFKKFPLTAIHRFHNFIHGKRIFRGQPIFGISFQIISVVVILIVLLLLS